MTVHLALSDTSGRRFCLWGGGYRDIQIGSPTDRRVQTQLRMQSNLVLFARALRESLLPALRRGAVALQALADALRAGHLGFEDGYGSATDLENRP